MSYLVTAVIRQKGRLAEQFLNYFGVELFSDKEHLIREAAQVLGEDAQRVKGQELSGSTILSKEDVEELLGEYSKDFPELKNVLSVGTDYTRDSKPYRIVFDSIDGVVDGQEFRLVGEENPIETLKDNKVDIAVTSSDLLLNKFMSLLPYDINYEDPSEIFKHLPTNETTVQYEGTLKINTARHMLVMNYEPGEVKVDERGMPTLEEGSEIYINGAYYKIYERLLNGRYRFNEGEKVEPAVLRVDGRDKKGIEVLSTSYTIMREAEEQGSKLVVYHRPIFSSEGIILSNKATKAYAGARKLGGIILEIDKGLDPSVETTYQDMASNLGLHLIGK